MEKPDYSMFEDKTQDEAIRKLQNLAREQEEAEAAVGAAERALKIAKERLANVAEKSLPELMNDLKLETFQLQDGTVIGIKEYVRANIPKAQRDDAFAWLRATGNGKMIKRELGVQLAAGQDEIADTVAKAIDKLGLELDITDKQEVHNQTLVAFVKRRLEAGEEIPLGKIDVFRQRKSTIKHKD